MKIDLESEFEVWQHAVSDDFESETYFRFQIVTLLLSIAMDMRAVRERYELTTGTIVDPTQAYGVPLSPQPIVVTCEHCHCTRIEGTTGEKPGIRCCKCGDVRHEGAY
jgi:hypothetical protein